MSRWRITLLLASWEFRRYFKWKSQLVSMGIGLAIMAGIALVGPRLVDRAIAETTAVGVIGEQPFALPPAPGVGWRHGEPDELRSAYDAKDLGGLLTLHSDSGGTLLTRAEGGWVHTLRAALDGARRGARLAAHGLDPAVLSDLTAPFDLEVVAGDEETRAEGDAGAGDRGRPSKWDRGIALAMLGFMFGGVFSGTALLVTGITSEKQQLVTEQIVAAVPAQTWIDGKIIGIGFRALESTLELVVWALLGMTVWRGFVNPDFAGVSHVSAVLLLQVGVLATLGFCLWFCFFAAVAATIDDPNTSARGMFVLAPVLAPVLAIPAYYQPEGGFALVLSLLPPTATMALAVRLALTEVPAWQLVVAVAGMVATIAILRRSAGKVFAIATLMRGKEPSWREIWAAARRSG